MNELYDILRTTTERQCVDMMKKMEKQWDEGFTRYFKKSIEPKLGYFCAWSIANSCKLDPKNGITTNQSEGFNFLLKDFQSWKEVPLDSLLMSLKLIQGFYLEEVHRGKANLGTFRLKPKYARYVQFFFHKKQQNKTKQSVVLYHCSVFAKIVSEYDQEIPQSQTADNPMALFRFLHFCSVFFDNGTKKLNSVFLYHCSVFCTSVPFFPQQNKKRNSVFCTTVPFFAPLFRFFHNGTKKNGTVCFCTTVPFFPQRTKKRNSVVLYHCSVFCTSVPFFPQRNKKTEQCVFVPLFRFLHFCSVFSTTEQTTEQCVLYHCSIFCTIVPFFPQRNKKRNSGTKTHCSVFCTTVPFFALLFLFFHNRTKNGTVCFCTTVPFFAPLFRFFHNRTKNGTVCFCTTVPFFHFCSVFP